MFRLLHSASEAEYETQLALDSQRCDAAFEEYYIKDIHAELPTTTGTWVMEGLQLYDHYSGVTNNQSESLNQLFRDLQGWKEAPITCIVLALYQRQAFYLNEIRRGLAGIGDYHLTAPYTDILLSASVHPN